MTTATILFLIYWVICARILVGRYHKDWPELEKSLVRDNDVYNAIGQVPPSVKALHYVMVGFISPFVVATLILILFIGGEGYEDKEDKEDVSR